MYDGINCEHVLILRIYMHDCSGKVAVCNIIYNIIIIVYVYNITATLLYYI